MDNNKSQISLKIRKVWKDPVGSAIISACILAIASTAILGVKKAFSGNSDTTNPSNAKLTCTAVGPNTNVRKNQGLEHEVVFQIDRGEYFEIIKDGEIDIVHGKHGKWKLISFKQQQGWMFSGFMLCE